jgi:hypothetical protein
MSEQADMRVERALRSVLDERRPAQGVPLELRERVAEIPDRALSRIDGPLILRRIARVDVAGLAAAAVVILAFLGGVVSRAAIPAVGHDVTTVPGSHGLDADIDRLGLVTGVSDDVAWFVALVAVAILGITALAYRGRRMRVLGVTAGAVLAAAMVLATQTGVEFGYFWGPTLRLNASAQPPAGSDGPTVYYITAEPGQPFAATFDVHNPGPLPVRLEGLVDGSSPDATWLRWSALWYDDKNEGAVGLTSEAKPFVPIDIPSDGHLTLFVVGRAGRCALGPAFQLDQADTYGYSTIGEAHLAFSVLGWPGEAVVELPFRIAEPNPGTCS